MATTHDVRIWKLEKYEGKQKTTYRVRWVVDGDRFGESFETLALADSFRSKLLTAAREGEAFDTESGLPVSMLRATEVKSWFTFACEYADMKWPESSPKYRASLAESLMTITVPMLKGKPPCDPKTLRKALKIAFNLNTRNAPQTDESDGLSRSPRRRAAMSASWRMRTRCALFYAPWISSWTERRQRPIPCGSAALPSETPLSTQCRPNRSF